MSILIKGMEMPENCAECNFCVNGFTDESPMYECAASGSEIVSVLVDDGGNPFEFRPDWCPLVEVPPHGRLIDADALHDAMYHRAFETDGDTMWQSGCWVRYRAIEHVHESQPTIIEAEGSEE